jgi:hypothetical protein
MSYKPVKLNKEDVLRLRVRTRKRVPYDEVINLLVEGHEVFIAEMNRKTAGYVKKVISKRIGYQVDAYPSELMGQKGYTFKVSLVQQYLKGASQQGS